MNKQIEEDAEVKNLKAEIEKRVAFLHAEIRGMDLGMQNVKRFFRVYGRFHKLVCGADLRRFSHTAFLNDYLMNGDMKQLGHKKSKEWLEWHLKEVEITLLRMERYSDLVVKNKQLRADNIELKREVENLRMRCKFLERELYVYEPNKMKVSDKVRKYRLPIMYMPVSELMLSCRCMNVLKAACIEIVGELLEAGEEELLKYRNFGEKSLAELKDELAIFGLYFGMDLYDESSMETKEEI